MASFAHTLTTVKLKSLAFAALASAALSLSVSAPGSAQDSEFSLEALLQCDKIKNEADRLECFNAAVDALKSRGLDGASSDVAEEQTERNFGKKETQLSENAKAKKPKDDDEFGKRHKEDTPKPLNAGVTRYWRDDLNRHVFLLDNGQIWRAEVSSGISVPSKPKSIHIKKRLFGGFMARVKGTSVEGRSGAIKRLY